MTNKQQFIIFVLLLLTILQPLNGLTPYYWSGKNILPKNRGFGPNLSGRQNKSKWNLYFKVFYCFSTFELWFCFRDHLMKDAEMFNRVGLLKSYHNIINIQKPWGGLSGDIHWRAWTIFFSQWNKNIKKICFCCLAERSSYLCYSDWIQRIEFKRTPDRISSYELPWHRQNMKKTKPWLKKLKRGLEEKIGERL